MMADPESGQGPDDDTNGTDGLDPEAIFRKLKAWFLLDYERAAEWRIAAVDDFAYVSGDQWSDADKQILKANNRPVVVMNRIEPVIDSVAGSEVANRQEVQYLPRTQGDVQVNEVLTSAAKWFRDQCDAEDEESDAFRDTIVCGMGWTETRLDYDMDPDGAPVIERVDPLEMVWDSAAKKRNLVDRRRVFHIRRDIPIDEARSLCPGRPDQFEDGDYNASWVEGRKAESEPHENDDRTYNKPDNVNGEDSDGPSDKTVTMVRAQWYERVKVYRVADPTDPTGQNILTLEEDEFNALKAKVPGVKSVETTRKVYKQAYLGRVLLEIGEAPCKDHFSFNCITGKRARNKNEWYGLVRAMKDPQTWANKWLSQTMHIMNKTAKGGVAAERGKFFDDDVTGPDTWVRNEDVTWLKPGALSSGNPAFMPKPSEQFPNGTFELMQFAIMSIRDVSGVNVETLGLSQSQSQAARLDLQRKQSAMTILQPLFDSLRRYRKEQGRLLLYLIENYLSDGRLIKIVGEEGAQYVPLIRQPGVATYDVIVDEAPTSPNQKEATWAMLQQILPVIGKMLPPQTWLALMKYSPLPSSAQDDIKKSLEAQQSQPDPEQQKRDAELKFQNDKTQAEIANGKAKTQAEIENARIKAEADAQLKLRQAAMEAMKAEPTIDPVTGAVVGPPQVDPGAMMMGMLHSLEQGFKEIAAAMSAPKQIIRDQNGDPIGVAPMTAQGTVQ